MLLVTHVIHEHELTITLKLYNLLNAKENKHVYISTNLMLMLSFKFYIFFISPMTTNNDILMSNFVMNKKNI